MSTFITCKVVNKFNENEFEELIVCTDWNNYKINLVIIKNDDKILVGEALLEDFIKYAKTFDKTLESYIKEMQDILSGNNNDIEFVLKDNIFSWKRKRWSLGQINIKSITEAKHLISFIHLLINQNSKIRKCNLDLEKDNKDLKSQNLELKNTLDNIITCKHEMEESLYKRFALLLNSKKAKIRELKQELENLQKIKDPIFDATTDESDNDSETKVLTNNAGSKSTVLNNENIRIDEKKKTKINILRTDIVTKSQNILQKPKKFNISEVNSEIPSTNKNLIIPSNIGEDKETPDLLTDESECELVLEYKEEKGHESEMITNAINQEDSEEEMF